MQERLVCGALTLDLAHRRVLYDGRLVRTSPTEFKLLVLLARQCERTIDSSALIRSLWRGDNRPSYHTPLRNCIHRLRVKLEAAGCYDPVIINRPHIGYGLLRASTISYLWTPRESPSTMSPAAARSPFISPTSPMRT